VLRNSEGKRFMFDYIPEFFKAETADNEAEADAWYDDHTNNRRPPELLPRDEVARAINTEIKTGRGSPPRRRVPRHRDATHGEDIKRRLPSMYHQFKSSVTSTYQGADGGRANLSLRDGRDRGRRGHPGGDGHRPLRRR